MIAIIIKAKVDVICRSRRLRRIILTEASINIASMRKPNPIIVLLCIFLSYACKDKRTDSFNSLNERQIKECFCGWQSLLVNVLGDVTSACIKLLSVGMTSILHI